jgi:hypothetical protein
MEVDEEDRILVDMVDITVDTILGVTRSVI